MGRIIACKVAEAGDSAAIDRLLFSEYIELHGRCAILREGFALFGPKRK
jgi:hypothetical protein